MCYQPDMKHWQPTTIEKLGVYMSVIAGVSLQFQSGQSAIMDTAIAMRLTTTTVIA